MKKIGLFLLAGTFLILVNGCNTPNQFFDRVVLNTNLVADFGGKAFPKRLDQETQHINSSTLHKAQTIVENQITFITRAIHDIEGMSAWGEEEKELKNISLQLFQKVLPVYQNEYLSYAKLCDQKASDTSKQKIRETIDQKYSPEVDQLFSKIYLLGKGYADKHDINVKWGM